MKTKQFTAAIVRAANSEHDGTFVLSSETVDHYGDIVKADGWDLGTFARNPIALWQHDANQPIGRWENVRVDAGRLLGDLRLASTRLAQMAKQLIQDGVLRAVSVGFMPKDYEPRKEGGYLINAAELLEVSLVSIPANPDALLVAKNFDLSPDEMAAVFGNGAPASKSADPGIVSRAMAILSKSADATPTPTFIEGRKMNLNERIKARQEELETIKGQLADVSQQYAEDGADETGELVEALTSKAAQVEHQLETLVKAEQALVATIAQPQPKQKAPGILTTRKDYEPGELFFRQAAVTALSELRRLPVDEVIRQHYRNDKGLAAIMTKADSVIGTTTGTNWALPLVEEQVEGFLDLFTNNSIYGALRAGGNSLNFAGKGSIRIPSRGNTKRPAGGFVGEGAPIPVKEAYFTSQTLTPDKMAVIVPYSDELVDATSGQIESILRMAIINDTAEALDAILMDANAASATRPAGLANGISHPASAGATAANIIADVKTLMAGFVSDDEQKNVVLIMNGARRLGAMTVTTTTGERAFPEVGMGQLLGYTTVVSGNCTAANVYAVNRGEFVTAYDAPRFAISNTAVLHMEDTTPLEVVSGTGPTTADPVRSLFQTASSAIRMILPVTWAMRRTGQVSMIDTVAW